MKIVLATHSTALLAGLATGPSTNVAFMRRGDERLTFKGVTEVDQAILPIFGAHPLSNIFNQAPVLLVEGEDDERIWQQAVRSSASRIRLFPCPVNSIDRLSDFETEVNNIIGSVYDNAVAYSLRDRDVQPEYIDDIGYVRRMRLSCRAAENLMLSDDVLALAGTDWKTIEGRIRRWADQAISHPYHAAVSDFINTGLQRKDHDLKDIRNIIVGLMSSKPWEVLVGQAIANLAHNGGVVTGTSLASYLGQEVCTLLLRRPWN